VATIAATVSGIGWIVTYFQAGRSGARAIKQNATIKHIEAQLEELYGPLSFLLLEGETTFRDLLASLGRNYVFIQGKELTTFELKIWLFWVENDFFPRNEKIKELLATKTHLLEQSRMPGSHLVFLDHYNSWRINHLLWQKEQ